MMPPHVNDVHFDKNTFTITGYTLGILDLDEKLTVVDADTGEPVAFTHTFDCEREDRGSGPPRSGSVQSRCELEVVLAEPRAGRRVRLRFLDVDETVTIPEHSGAGAS